MKTWPDARLGKAVCSFFLAVFLAVWTALPVMAEEAEDIGILPDWLLKETEAPGEMVEVTYPSILRRDAIAGIYLPHDYDAAELYDVAFFFPGTGGTYTEAFTYEYPCTFQSGIRGDLSVQHLMDRLIEENRIRPLILVCMQDMVWENFYVADADFQTMLDYVKDHYSTYAGDESIKQEERRRHCAMLGFSQGAIYSEAMGLSTRFEDVAYVAAISYGSYWQVLEMLPASPYELELLYACSGGDLDRGAFSTKNAYVIISNHCGDKVRDGDNALHRVAPLYDHSYSLVQAALYDCLPRMFPSEKTKLMERYYGGYSPRRSS